MFKLERVKQESRRRRRIYLDIGDILNSNMLSGNISNKTHIHHTYYDDLD